MRLLAMRQGISRRLFRKSELGWLVGLRGVTAFVALCGCSAPPHEKRGDSERVFFVSSGLGRSELRLIFMTDWEGQLEPCGCTSKPLGGIDRVAALIRRIKSEGTPTLFFVAGNAFFGHVGHPADIALARAQMALKAQTLGEALLMIGPTALLPGPADFSNPDFQGLKAKLPFLRLFGEIEKEAQGKNWSFRVGSEVLRIGKVTVGVVGLLAQDESSFQELNAAFGAHLLRLKAEKAEITVGLFSAPKRLVRRLLNHVEGLDFALLGAQDEAAPSLPLRIASTWVFHAGRQGQYLILVDLFGIDRKNMAWVDASNWSREVERARLLERARDLQSQIEAWEKEAKVSREDIETQKGRLARLQAQAEMLSRPQSIEGKRAFSAQLFEISQNLPAEPTVQALLEAHNRRVNDHNRLAFADWKPDPPPPGHPAYVGSVACAPCHEAAYKWWQLTPHGQAYSTLVKLHKEYSLDCVGCHVTGYREPGGSTLTHTGPLQNVGCESCHRPGGQHVDSPREAAFNVAREVPEGVCLRCHTPDHSDRFNYQVYRR
ncbi:MAG: hypothetical protein N2515_05515, partial [Deltaproteobacteria bacterium]|nr:hypothetical protein [Deltaproteobacteria bacterium]